jgi:TRAP-type C4-dicarboxylate transport system substrate-binding protein
MSSLRIRKNIVLIIATLLIAICLLISFTLLPVSPAPVSAKSTESNPTPENPIVLVQANWIPEYQPDPMGVDPFHWVAEEWMNTIEEETGGRVKFERYPNSTLVDGYSMYKAVMTGVIDVGAVFPLANPDAFPMVNALSVPGLFPSATVAGLVNWKLYEEGYISNDYKNVKRLFVGYANPQGFICRDKQIKTLEDLEGLRIGCMSEPDISTVALLGATPVVLPVQEHPSAMERGVIDGSYYEESASIAYGLYKVARYFTDSHGGIRSSETMMNLDTYNQLPPDIKKIFDKNSGMMWCLINGVRFDQNLKMVREFLNHRADEVGLPHIYQISPEEEARWQVAFETVQEKYIENLESRGLPGRAMMERAKELIDVYEELSKLYINDWKFLVTE